jgi:hypothetical protein
MDQDWIERIEIDGDGRLLVVPANYEFPLIYRAGMEVDWDSKRRALHSPKPREWSYSRWYEQILAAAAQEHGCELRLTDDTEWVNIEPDMREVLLNPSGTGA